LALHHYIYVGTGVVDEDYHGNLSMILFNHSDKPFHVSPGDRIAEPICQNIYYPDLEEVQELDDTESGKN
jgi:dUTP pyrophosphatase